MEIQTSTESAVDINKSRYAQYLQSEHWIQFREKVLEYWDGKCVLCYSDWDVNVHHRTYQRIGGELLTDVIVLCLECHEKHHDIIPNIDDNGDWYRHYIDRQILYLWDIAASSMATRTQPVSIARGIMFVNVTDSVVLQRLTFYKNEFIDRINLMSGKRVIRDITFRVGKVLRGDNNDQS